ncbi:hypothetical protein NQ317_003198, partial [Molorchus minor]
RQPQKNFRFCDCEVSLKEHLEAGAGFRSVQNVQKPTENALLVYFDEKSKVVSSSTLWAHYPMLNSVINIRENVDIGEFPKEKNEGFKPKKNQMFSRLSKWISFYERPRMINT